MRIKLVIQVDYITYTLVLFKNTQYNNSIFLSVIFIKYTDKMDSINVIHNKIIHLFTYHVFNFINHFKIVKYH